MIAREGDVKLTDFGIAKALDLMYNEEGIVIAGKDEYLSEQARREVTDARADLFLLHNLLSEMLVGEKYSRPIEKGQLTRTYSNSVSRISQNYAPKSIHA